MLRSSRNAVKNSTKRRARFAPRLEALEHRVVPVLDPYQPMPVPPGFVTEDGVPLDGVVQLNWPLPGGRTGVCTGAFLGDDERQGSDDKMTPFTRPGNAQHILTAAHCITDENGMVDVPEVTVSFYLPSKAQPYTFKVPSSNYRLLTGIWNGDTSDGNDIALLDLGEIGPVGPNGIGATPFPINTVPDEGEKQFEFAGYGNTGTGSGGQQTGTTGTKRYGYNVIDCSGGNQLSYDFDSGDWWDNTLDPICGSAETPVKTHDSMMGQGDSGGPNFLYDAIAGITSYGYQINELGDPDFDFGDIGVVERVSAHRDWIRGLMDVPRDVTLNMDNQPFGKDGGADRIDVDRSGNNILIWVNGNFWVDLPKAGVNSLTIVGSSDNEDVHIQASLGERVTFNGNGGANRMLIKDTPDAVTCTANVNQVSCNKGFSYATTAIPQNVNYLEIAGGTRDSVFVHGVKSGTPVTVWHASTVDVGNGTMTDINDVVTVHKALTVNIKDSANASATDYDVRWSKVEVNTSGTVRTVNPFNVTFVNIFGGSGGNEFTVFDTSAVQTRLYTGLGLDFTTVRASSPGSVSIYGQASNDFVQLGFNQSVQAIGGTVNISNQGGFTTTNVENHADAAKRTVILGNSTAGYVELSGLAPGKIRVEGNSVNNLNIWAGPAGNTFYVLTTPLGAGFALTNIRTGMGDDWMNVYGTKGSLKVDAQAGTNLLFVGSWDSGLNKIDGAVDLSGPGGVNTLNVYDNASTTGHDYVLNANLVHRTDKEMIFHQEMSNVSVSGGFYTDTFTVKDTGQPTTIYANDSGIDGESDHVVVERTTAPLTVYSIGKFSAIDVGNATSSLDNIQGKITVVPDAGSQMTLSMIDTATTTLRKLRVNGNGSGQTYERTFNGSTEWRTVVDVVGEPIKNFEYRGGSGGIYVYADSTAPGTSSKLLGHAGVLDWFSVGFFADTNKILGEVAFVGQSADDDYAYYYDYYNPNPQTYTIQTSPIIPDLLTFARTGNATVAFQGIGDVISYTPLVGGSVVNIQGTAEQMPLSMGVGHGDIVTLGSLAPNLGGTMDGFKAWVSIGNYDYQDDVALVVDDSGNQTAGAKQITLAVSDTPFDHYEYATGTGSGVYWALGTDANVQIRTGMTDDTFVMQNTTFGTPIAIDAGGGVNTLDYSASSPAMPGLVSWWKGENNAFDAVGGHQGTLEGDTTFTTGKVGQAFSFDGDGDYVFTWNSPSLEPKTVSVEAWVNSTVLTEFGEYNYILAKGAKGFSGASYALVTSNNSGLWFYVGNGSAFAYSPDAGTGIWDGNWHHVVGTYDGTHVRLYVDGVEVGNGTEAVDFLGYGLPDSNELYIGTYGGIAGYSFDGLIDEPSVFNRALSAEEVQKLFDAGSAGKSALAMGVTVNLRTSTASGLAGGIANIKNVIGSASHDILVGNGGNVLTGGSGRDLLIAGLTASQLFGGDDEDILIGGTTIHDQDEESLEEIRAIWTSSADYNTRVQALRTGLLNDDAGAVSSNGQQNTLFGQGGTDLFFLSGLDQHDAVEGEEFVGI